MSWYKLGRIIDHIYSDNGPGSEWIGDTWTRGRVTIVENDLGLNYHGGKEMWRSSKTCVRASITRWVEEVDAG